MISFALLLSISTSHFVAPNSRIINEQHYVTLTENQLHLYDEVGTRTSSIKLPPTADPEFQYRVEGPSLNTASGAIEVASNSIRFSDTKAQARILSKSQLELRRTIQGSSIFSHYSIEPIETYDYADLSFPSSGSVVRVSHEPYVVTIKQVLKLPGGNTGSSYHVFALDNSTARRLISPLPYTCATYVDDTFILGWAKDSLRVDWATGNLRDNRPEALSPFICRMSDLSVTLLKKVSMPKVKLPQSSEQVNGSIGIIPRTIDSTGTLVLCDRYECIQPEREGEWAGEIIEPAKFKYNVVLFRNGQAEVLGKMQVEGQTVTPTRVISAKGTFAILEGTDSKGKTVTFTYHLR